MQVRAKYNAVDPPEHTYCLFHWLLPAVPAKPNLPPLPRPCDKAPKPRSARPHEFAFRGTSAGAHGGAAAHATAWGARPPTPQEHTDRLKPAGALSTAGLACSGQETPLHRSWRLGLFTQKKCGDVMTKIYAVLKAQNFRWKVINPFQVRSGRGAGVALRGQEAEVGLSK